MQVTPEVIEQYKEILFNPEKHGLKMKPFKDYFKKSEKFNTDYDLAALLMKVNRNIPKMFIYLYFHELFGMPQNVDGKMGYYLEFCE